MVYQNKQPFIRAFKLIRKIIGGVDYKVRCWLVPFLFVYKTGFPCQSSPKNLDFWHCLGRENPFSPPKQSQKSRAILKDGSRSMDLGRVLEKGKGKGFP